MGGPGGGGPPGGGMGPGGGRGGGGGFGPGMGPGGRGGGGGRALAEMDPQQRQRLQQALRQRAEAARQNGAPVFGNRRARNDRNAIRGGAFVNLRNSAFDAAPYSVNGNTLVKPEYATTRFGLNLGGGLKIPKLIPTDANTFFFLNYSGSTGRNPFSTFGIAPTEAERSGDFSSSLRGGPAVIIDPLTKTPFPSSRIPDSRIDPVARGLLALIPLPNQSGATQNYRLVDSIPSTSHNVNLRLNHSIGRNDRFAFTMGWQNRDAENIQTFGYRDLSQGSGRNYDLSWTHNFKPRLIHTARVRYNLNQNQLLPYFAFGEDISGKLGIRGNSREPINYGPPNLNFTNYFDLTDGSHSDRRVHTWNVNESLLTGKGAHSLTLGWDLQRTQWNSVAETNARGTLFFGGLATSLIDANGNPVANTGSDFADFLLGLPQQSSVRYLGADTYLRGTNLAAFAQDEWRAKPNLTFNLGVRYEVFRPMTEKYGRMANLDINPSFTQVAVVTPGVAGPFSGAYPDGLIDTDWNNVSPRFGFAWRPWPKKRTQVRGGYSIFYDGSIFSRIPTRLASQPPFAQASTFNSSAANVLTLADPFTGPASVNVTNTYAVDRNYIVPYVQTWSLGIQNDLPWGMTAEVSYLGTKGTHLVMQRLPNRAAPGSVLTAEERRRIGNAVGFTFDSTEGNSVLHSGTLRITKRMQRGLSWNAVYTWSKSIDNATSIGGTGSTVVQNDLDFAAERGLSAFDRRHTFAFNAMLTSPVGPNGIWLRQNNILTRVLRDWSLQTSLTGRTGTPLTARVSGSAADAAGSGATGTARADATGLPVSGGSGYFNKLAFTIPPAGRYGNAGRNTIPGPGFLAMNASFGRFFQLGDTARRRVDIRLEANNILNQVNITSFGTTVNAANYGLATNASAMRTVQLMMRVQF